MKIGNRVLGDLLGRFTIQFCQSLQSIKDIQSRCQPFLFFLFCDDAEQTPVSEIREPEHILDARGRHKQCVLTGARKAPALSIRYAIRQVRRHRATRQSDLSIENGRFRIAPTIVRFTRQPIRKAVIPRKYTVIPLGMAGPDLSVISGPPDVMHDAHCPLPRLVQIVLKLPQQPDFRRRDVYFNQSCCLTSIPAVTLIDGPRREKAGLKFIIESLLLRPGIATAGAANTFSQKRSIVCIGVFQQLQKWMDDELVVGSEYLLLGRFHECRHISTRQYARIARDWVTSMGLEASAYGTH